MYPFKVYRFENQVIINEKHRYRQGEILTRILNMDFTKLKEKYLEARIREGQILFPLTGENENYNQTVYWFQNFFAYVDSILMKLPPYNKTLKPERIRQDILLSMLSSYPILFKDYSGTEEEYAPHDIPDDEDMAEYEYEDMDDPEERLVYNETFAPKWPDDPIMTNFTPGYLGREASYLASELNKKIMRLYDTYMSTAAEVLRAAYLYSDLLDNYIHTLPSLQDSAKVAEAYQHFFEKKENEVKQGYGYPFDRMVDATGMTVSHKVIPCKDEKGRKGLGLWEVTRHGGLGSFLYEELFLGLQTGLLPKRCQNCGRYFLLSSGYNADFCEQKAPGEDGKTCRDVGARRRYDDKVKNDPVWLAYQRAYKTHYARVSKKKMTKPEFAAWSDMAVELRGRALNGELEFEEYVRRLKPVNVKPKY